MPNGSHDSCIQWSGRLEIACRLSTVASNNGQRCDCCNWIIPINVLDKFKSSMGRCLPGEIIASSFARASKRQQRVFCEPLDQEPSSGRFGHFLRRNLARRINNFTKWQVFAHSFVSLLTTAMNLSRESIVHSYLVIEAQICRGREPKIDNAFWRFKMPDFQNLDQCLLTLKSLQLPPYTSYTYKVTRRAYQARLWQVKTIAKYGRSRREAQDWNVLW